MVSRFKAKINPSGMVAPSRFSMIGCGIATTLAVIMRLHCAGVACGCAAGSVSLGSLALSSALLDSEGSEDSIGFASGLAAGSLITLESGCVALTGWIGFSSLVTLTVWPFAKPLISIM